MRTEEATVEEIDTKEPIPSEPEAAAVAEPGTPPPTKSALPRPVVNTRRGRREKSGVPALDRFAADEDTEATEAEREDDDWDFIEAADGEDRNGAKGTSLFARGVVDRYRLAVFRKASTPNAGRTGQRTASGMSIASGVSEAESPSPSQRRGRTGPGLTFRKQTRQFLRPKSPPPSSFTAKSARSVSHSASAANTLSGASLSSAGGMLTPSHSGGSTFGIPHSLKSKESAMSMGAMSQSSGHSGNGQSAVFVEASEALRGSSANGIDAKYKNKKLKKYKNNAEKVFSLFSSPRQST